MRHCLTVTHSVMSHCSPCCVPWLFPKIKHNLEIFPRKLHLVLISINNCIENIFGFYHILETHFHRREKQNEVKKIFLPSKEVELALKTNRRHGSIKHG